MRNPPSKRSKKASKGSAPARRKLAAEADNSASDSHEHPTDPAENEECDYAARNTAGGRKPPYKPEYAEAARSMCERGATTDELAEFFRVSAKIINYWRLMYPEFSEASKIVEDACDERAKRSMFENSLLPNSAGPKAWFDFRRKDRAEKRLEGPPGSPLSRLFDAICGHSFQPVAHEDLPRRDEKGNDLEIEGLVNPPSPKMIEDS